MHEMSITKGIIDICQHHADGRRVLVVDIEIGELSNIVPDSIEFCFEACSRGTLLENAKLNIIRTLGRGICLDCSLETVMDSIFASCSICGSHRVRMKSGDEMRVREIEVE